MALTRCGSTNAISTAGRSAASAIATPSQRTSPGFHATICCGDGRSSPETETTGGGGTVKTGRTKKSNAAFNMIEPPQYQGQTSAIAGAYKIEKQRFESYFTPAFSSASRFASNLRERSA
ncbi:MAG: hypothetical protein J7499_00410 [Sphingopyxis sp.]|nr:hypothetical protein [Sphingopyxis sp.]